MANVHQSKSHKIWILHLGLELRNPLTKPSKLKGLSILHLQKKRDRIRFSKHFSHNSTHKKANGSFFKAPPVTSSSKEMISQHIHSPSWHLSMSPHASWEALDLEDSKVSLAHDTHDRYFRTGKMVKLEWGWGEEKSFRLQR